MIGRHLDLWDDLNRPTPATPEARAAYLDISSIEQRVVYEYFDMRKQIDLEVPVWRLLMGLRDGEVAWRLVRYTIGPFVDRAQYLGAIDWRHALTMPDELGTMPALIGVINGRATLIDGNHRAAMLRHRGFGFSEALFLDEDAIAWAFAPRKAGLTLVAG